MLVFGIYFYYFTNASCFLPLVVPKTVILGRKPFVIIQLSSPSLLNPLGQVQASPVPFWKVRFQSSLQHLKVALHSQPSASKSAEILRDNHAHGTIVKSFNFLFLKKLISQLQSDICILQLQLQPDNCVVQSILIETVLPVGHHSLGKSRLVP